MASTFSERVCVDTHLSFVADTPIGINIHTEDVDVKVKCGIPLSEESITLPNLDEAEEFVNNLDNNQVSEAAQQ